VTTPSSPSPARTTGAASPTPSSPTRSRSSISTRSTSSGWRRTGPRSSAARRATRRDAPTSRTSCGCTAANGEIDDLGRRFLACFLLALDDAGVPAEPELRACLRAYMEWAVADVLVYSPQDAQVPTDAAMPRWTWGGLAENDRPRLSSS
jgi:hypothetical protein